jgi:hypothetical protein
VLRTADSPCRLMPAGARQSVCAMSARMHVLPLSYPQAHSVPSDVRTFPRTWAPAEAHDRDHVFHNKLQLCVDDRIGRRRGPSAMGAAIHEP